VATTTGSIKPLLAAARHTHSTIGRPAIVRSTLRLSRVELSRAGITAAIRNVLMQASLQDWAAWVHLARDAQNFPAFRHLPKPI
jgi:hypothetical protein